MITLTAPALEPLLRSRPPDRPPLRIGLIQHRWRADPYGRVLVSAPRDEEAVLVADLDLDQRRDWLELLPFLLTRRPDTYTGLTRPVATDEPYGAGHAATAVVK